MKIAVLNIYNGIVNRGAEHSTHNLALQLNKNHEIHLFQGGKEKDQMSYQIHVIPVFCPNYKDTSFSFLRKFYLDFWSLQILLFTILALPLLWKENFDIVIPINGGWQTAICRIATWLKRSKMIIIGRAGVGRDDAWNLLWRPDIFVALTSAAFSWAKKRAPKLKIINIPNGVDLTHFKPERKVAKVPLEKPIILCAAALQPNKRIDLTIKAVAGIKEASLLVLGSGPMEKELRELGVRLIGNGHFLLKSVTFEEMPNYYQAASIFTLGSKTGEAFGNVYLEAMACNLPVVATNDESRREIVGKGGILVDPEKTDDYSNVLKMALGRDFGCLPRQQAEKFSWEKITEEYEKLFKAL